MSTELHASPVCPQRNALSSIHLAEGVSPGAVPMGGVPQPRPRKGDVIRYRVWNDKHFSEQPVGHIVPHKSGWGIKFSKKIAVHGKELKTISVHRRSLASDKRCTDGSSVDNELTWDFASINTIDDDVEVDEGRSMTCSDTGSCSDEHGDDGYGNCNDDGSGEGCGETELYEVPVAPKHRRNRVQIVSDSDSDSDCDSDCDSDSDSKSESESDDDSCDDSDATCSASEAELEAEQEPTPMPKCSTQYDSAPAPATEPEDEHKSANAPAIANELEPQPEPHIEPQPEPHTEPQPEPELQSRVHTGIVTQAKTGLHARCGPDARTFRRACRKRDRDDNGGSDVELHEARSRAARRQRTSYNSTMRTVGCLAAAGYAGFTLGAGACAAYEPAAACLNRLFAPYIEDFALGVVTLAKGIVARSRSFVG